MKSKFITLFLLLSAVSCSNDNNNVLQRLNEAPATVREVQGANSLFVLELANNTNGLYGAYVVPSTALLAEYKEDGLSVLISGNVTNNYAAIDGYISEGKGNTVTIDGLYNTVEVTAMSKNDEVPYKNCIPEGVYIDQIYLEGIGYLFIDFIPDEFQKCENMMYITYNRTDDLIAFSADHTEVNYSGNICNFPDFAKELEISSMGTPIYYRGILHVTGMYLSIPPYIGGDLILTNMTISNNK